MANTLRLKRSAVSGRVPATTDLSLGEVAINTNDGRVFLKKDDGTEAIVEVIADDGAGNVGIGTTSPDGTLHVHTATAGSVTANANADNLIVENSGAGGISILTPNASAGGLFFGSPGDNIGAALRWNHDNNQFAIGPDKSGAHLRLNSGDGLERMRIDSSGNVGIGTTSPNHALDLIGTTSNALRIRSSTAATRGLEIWNDSGNDIAYISNYYNGSIVFQTGNTERARIDSSGRLLLGTTTEGYADADNLTIADSGNCGITIRSGTTNAGAIFFSDATSGGGEYDGFIEYKQNNNYMRFATAQAERMRIDSSGNVGIGETAPAADLVVKQSGNTFTTASQTVALFQRNPTTGHAAKIAIVGGNLASSDIHFGDTDDEDVGIIHYVHQDNSLRFTVNASERMRIDSSGRLGIGTTSPGKELDVQGSIRSVGTSATIGLPVGTTAQRPGSPAQGDLRFNSTDTAAEIYDGSAWSAVGSGGGATGGGSDQWAVEHDNTITTSYTISSGKNVISAGPLTVNSGAVVTVPSGSNWVIV